MKYIQLSFLKKSILTSVVFCPLAAFAEEPKDKDNESDWEVSLGLGAAYGAKHRGVDKSEVIPLPVVAMNWNDRVFFNPGDGLGIVAYGGDSLEVSFSVSADLGRRESYDSSLDGLGNIGMSTVLSNHIDYSIGPLKAFISTDKYLDGSQGTSAKTGFRMIMPLDLLTGKMTIQQMKELEGRPDSSVLNFSFHGHWGDEKYNQAYWGVNSTQAANSVYDEYKLGSGFNGWGASLGIMTPLSESWSFVFNVNYDEMSGDVADSPIITAKDKWSYGAFFKYDF